MPTTTNINISISKETFFSLLSTASRFTSSRLSTSPVLQGIYLVGSTSHIHCYATNLTTYYHTQISVKDVVSDFSIIIEPKKIIEFVSLLPGTDITLTVSSQSLSVSQGKTKGTFPLIESGEFPLPPQFDGQEQPVDVSFFEKNLPLLLFSTATDETRPVLTGVNFLSRDNELVMVTTDGFRLSVIKQPGVKTIPSMIVPADFLSELYRLMKGKQRIIFKPSLQEKILQCSTDTEELYSRLIEGDFPPFDRVVPVEWKTKITVNRHELLRNIKLISVFAREYSNIVVFHCTPEGLTLKTKKDQEDNGTFVEASLDGEDQRIAFNYRYVLDILNHLSGDTIVIEVLRSEAPIIFKEESNPSYIHIIMPVRLDS